MCVIFNEPQAQETIQLINRKVAACFGQEHKKIRFVFLSYIASKRTDCKTLGMCIHGANEIQICLVEGWQNTVIHELVHFYNPLKKEKQVNELTTKVIKYLKGFLRNGHY